MAGRFSQYSRLKPVHPLVTISAAAASGPSGYSLNAVTSPRAARRVLRGARFAFRCCITASAVSGLSTVSSSSLGVGSRACALPSEGWFLFWLWFWLWDARVCGGKSVAFASALSLFFNDLDLPPFAPAAALNSLFLSTFCSSNVTRLCRIEVPSRLKNASTSSAIACHFLTDIRAIRASFTGSFGRDPLAFHIAISRSM